MSREGMQCACAPGVYYYRVAIQVNDQDERGVMDEILDDRARIGLAMHRVMRKVPEEEADEDGSDVVDVLHRNVRERADAEQAAWAIVHIRDSAEQNVDARKGD